jgi:hypothetical protein
MVALSVRCRAREKYLNNADPRSVEGICRRGHVKSPHSIPRLANEVTGLVRVLLEPTYPVTERFGVMLAKALHITSLETRALSGADGCGERNKLSIGEYIPLDKTSLAPDSARRRSIPVRLPCVIETDDTVIEEQAARSYQVGCDCEIILQLRAADVFEHPDTYHFIERDITRKIAIVTSLYLASILKPFECNAVAGQRGLSFTDGNSQGGNTVMPHCVTDQTAPTASDVQ